ncbi:MAG: hypothetical protein K2X39_01900, partial [Silvanigrellaceae bacterium]|nr:hypothetical protein [Silvanigrellaceae bacterium]
MSHHHIDAKKREYSNEAIIRHWCEEQLGQWLFIIDDVQIEPEWLKQYLPQKGGHVLITTSKPSYSLPKEAQILSFSPLSHEDSNLLLKAWLGKYWEASGYQKEEQALTYLSQALGGSPALLTQMALLVRKKGLSFERLKAQFDNSDTRGLHLADRVFDQLQCSFSERTDKSVQQVINAFRGLYSQLNEEHLNQFIIFLKEEAAEIETIGQYCISDELFLGYWEGVLASFSLPSETNKLREILKLLPFSYDNEKQHWIIALAGLHALEFKDSVAFNPQITLKKPEELAKEIAEREHIQIPSGINFSMHLNDSSINAVDIAILTAGKPSELKAWRLPSVNFYFIPRPALTEEIKEKLPNKETNGQTSELILAAASGMGGIGKTELARHFITEPELPSHYQRRFWFNATSHSQLKNELYDLAIYLGLVEPKKYIEDKELINRMHRWFNLNPGWLMVFDNADEYNSIADGLEEQIIVAKKDGTTIQ